MKTILLFLLFFSYSALCVSQNFCPPEAKWHYNQGIMTGPQNYPALIEPVAQQNVGGHSCTKLQITGSSCSMASSYLIYESNDTVYYFVDSLLGFSMLYDFSAVVGDVYTVYGAGFGGYDSIKVQIDSITTRFINGVARKQFFTSQPGLFHSSLELGSNYIEGIGSNEFLFPQYFGCDPITFGLRCYQDSVLGLYETGIAPSCDSVFILGWSELSEMNAIRVIPNPFQNRISLRGLTNGRCEISIVDLLGNKVYESRQGEEEIMLANLPKGIYIISIDSEKNRIRKKIIKD